MHGIRILTIALFAACLGASPLWAEAEEQEIAARLERDATAVLERMFGPGRAEVLVTVEGESSQIQTQSEMITPIRREPPTERPDMPGYEPSKDEVDYYQKDLESSARRASFLIKRILLTVVLDETLTSAQENDVRRVLPDLLRMDVERGDEMAVLRAKILPPWKALWASPKGLHTLSLSGAGAVLIIFICVFVCVVAYVASVRISRAFAVAVVSRFSQERPPAAPRPPSFAAGPYASGEGDLLLPGGAPSIIETIGEFSPFGAPPAIGRRFDFLAAREPADVAELLSKEPAADLALMFAYLADSDPDLASRVFAQLPPEIQADASQALVDLETVDPVRLGMIESRLKSMIEFGVRGPERLARILSRMAPEKRESVLGTLTTRDPEGAELVERTVFPFESIAEFKSHELRRLIATVPYEDWGVALRGAPRKLVSSVLAELPAEARQIVKVAAESPQSKENVLECRSKILSWISALSAKGQLMIAPHSAPRGLA
ncbi:MAG: FliG C-terminal domain-containing protein [Elusimicrobiota bacterium]